MKKMLLILPAALLAACDKPIQEVNLDCGSAFKEKQTYVNAKIYKNRAELLINNSIAISMQNERKDYISNSKYLGMTFSGKMPDSDKSIYFYVYGDAVRQVVNSFAIGFRNNHSHGCNVEVPFNISHSKLNETEKCIEEISDLIFCNGSCANDKNFSGLSFRKNYSNVKLTADQAIKLSPNWDYNNPKFYQNNEDGILHDYEKDACETLARVEAFIDSYGYDFTDCDEEDMQWTEKRDKLLKCPAWPWLAEIQKKEKTAKILSEFKPNFREDARAISIADLQSDKEYIYVNDLREVREYGYDERACYRVVGETDAETGYHAVEICDDENQQ